MMEQLYTDFTTKLLPTIQEGLVITKDYFLDLFGRYIKYLIITDLLWAFVFLILSVVSLIYAKKLWKYQWDNSDYIDHSGFFFLGVIFTGIFIFGTIAFITRVTNVVKDVYIPEIRIYEQLKEYNFPREK